MRTLRFITITLALMALLNGAGTVVVRVSDKLDVTINGVGSVEYIGDPIVTQTVNGLGTVNKR